MVEAIGFCIERDSFRLTESSDQCIQSRIVIDVLKRAERFTQEKRPADLRVITPDGCLRCSWSVEGYHRFLVGEV